MFLRVCNSGSSANGYAIGDDKEVLLLEAGCSFLDMKKMLDFRVDNIVGMCVSHEHSDHFRHVKEYEKAGIHVFKPFDYIDGIRISGAYSDNFKVYSFELPHGETKSYGFYITHPELGKLLFLTDCEYSPVSFKDMKVNHILCECNYDTKYVDMDAPNFRHKVEGHMNLDTCREFVRHNASPELRSVVLIHGSTATLNPSEAVQAIKDVVDPDVAVEYAVKGLEMELKKNIL